MVVLIGPCMFLAPLVILLIPVALVLWPPALVLTGLAWLLLWPFARGEAGSGVVRAHRKLGKWFRTLLTPWTYFDVPARAAKAAAAAGKAPASPGAVPAAQAAQAAQAAKAAKEAKPATIADPPSARGGGTPNV